MPDLSEQTPEDRMAAMIRDPETIFVYWDLSDTARTAAEEGAGGANWILRLINLNTGASSDVSIEPDARNWYVPVLPDAAYKVQMGLLDREGRFRFHDACGPVRTPPLSYSPLYDKQWMILEEDYRKLLALGWSGFLGSSGATSPNPGRETEAAWITVVSDPSEPTQDTPTSPGVPQYKGRK